MKVLVILQRKKVIKTEFSPGEFKRSWSISKELSYRKQKKEPVYILVSQTQPKGFSCSWHALLFNIQCLMEPWESLLIHVTVFPFSSMLWPPLCFPQ